MPDCEVVTAGDTPTADLRLARRRIPYLGAAARGPAAVSWFSGQRRLEGVAADIVMTVELFSPLGAQARRIARETGARHVALVYENLVTNPLYRIPPWRGLASRSARESALLVAVTDQAASHVRQRWPTAPVVVCTPGIDLDVFHPAASGLEANPVVTMVAQLRQDVGTDKGIDTVVAAGEMIAADTPGFRLQLVGDGPMRAALEERAARLPFLAVLGPRSRGEVAEILRSSRALVLGSRQTVKWAEQLGYCLLEALAAGLPVVATRSGAIAEIVPAGNHLVEEGDITAMAAALRQAIGPSAAPVGMENRRAAEVRFDIRLQARRLRTLLSATR
jgi:glycosyltransferase involved in cell wall biosynthesis